MRKGFRTLLGLFLVFGMMTANTSVTFSQAEEKNLSTEALTGKIISINSEKSAVVIKYLMDKETQTHRTAIFSFDSAIEVEKDGEIADVSDLKDGDVVTLQYRTDAEGKNIVDLIVVEP